MTASTASVSADAAVQAPPRHAPFRQTLRVHSLADIRRIEALAPLAQAMPVRSTYEIMCNSAAAFGDKTALTFLRSADPADAPIRWSYRQLLAGIHQTANALHRLGVQPSDAVAVLLPGCLDYHLALWGGEAAAIVQPLNPLLSDEKLVALMRAAGARVLIAYGAEADAEMWSKALRIRSQVPSLTTLLRVPPLDEPASARPALPDGVQCFRALIEAQPSDRLLSGRDIQASDIAAYFHTGGTTGAPKLARHSHGAQVFTAWSSVQVQGLGPDDVTLNGYPLFHVAGVLPGALTALSAGVETVIPTTALMRNREVIRNYWKLVQTYRTTVLSAVPTVLAALANVPVDGADISSLRYARTGAAPLPPELSARYQQLFGLQVHESLGMTEMAGISTITPPGVVAPAGCVGFPLPFVQLRIVRLDASGNASDEDLPVGQPGMILFKSPNLFSGFVDPADNARAFTADGWLATGDLGFVDEQGRLHISGRSKDLIIRSGHNIDPKVIEDAVAAHPAVQLSAAVGAPDAYAGELPVLFVSLVPGQSASVQELLDFTAQRVDEAPARPRHLTILDALPMTNVGKIFKPDLRVLATRAVIAELAETQAREAGLATPPALDVQVQGERYVVAPATPTALPEAFRQGLAQALARLPVQAQWQDAPAALAPASAPAV
ncbi:acyl-CoA synthetase [Curvibacter sp. HBC28]|uniref:Acyl-CoA synthetase n=1 Tax=Curvibacter microcysteis TaxID=3026419 RepID=A0ABT5MPD9_9BURK|nr:acyl-CoA synthetase [Curvibacter sp. HBC28]MDD0817096.1 acyl-CoA synthetase [Curvibacter sp. HBC28]